MCRTLRHHGTSSISAFLVFSRCTIGYIRQVDFDDRYPTLKKVSHFFFSDKRKIYSRESGECKGD